MERAKAIICQKGVGTSLVIKDVYGTSCATHFGARQPIFTSLVHATPDTPQTAYMLILTYQTLRVFTPQLVKFTSI